MEDAHAESCWCRIGRLLRHDCANQSWQAINLLRHCVIRRPL
jgi:hypothetical protein